MVVIGTLPRYGGSSDTAREDYGVSISARSPRIAEVEVGLLGGDGGAEIGVADGNLTGCRIVFIAADDRQHILVC